jgi:hypothetical protein
MCRNIRTLYNFEPPTTEEEVREAAVQYVRKISGMQKPSQTNAEVFERAIDEVAATTSRLMQSLVTSSPPRDREVEAERRRARAVRGSNGFMSVRFRRGATLDRPGHRRPGGAAAGSRSAAAARSGSSACWSTSRSHCLGRRRTWRPGRARQRGGREEGTPSTLAQDCRTGEDANQREDCRIVAVVNSVQSFWTGAFERSNRDTCPSTRCSSPARRKPGALATSAVGPFYCPADKLVTSTSVLRRRQVPARRGVTPFVQAYVIAHEYGHHVQDQLGPDQIRGAGRPRQERPFRAPGRLLRGRVGANAVETGLIDQLTQADINLGLAAAPRSETTASSRRRRARSTGDLDARLVRTAAALVLPRLPAGDSGSLQHLLRLDLARDRRESGMEPAQGCNARRP